MSLSPMSHVELKKWPCHPVDFRGQGPYLLWEALSKEGTEVQGLCLEIDGRASIITAILRVTIACNRSDGEYDDEGCL